jgi:hypothetical protein
VGFCIHELEIKLASLKLFPSDLCFLGYSDKDRRGREESRERKMLSRDRREKERERERKS